jgi:tetratricopeptide (TPR) repeat protein/WD40 repeat protein
MSFGRSGEFLLTWSPETGGIVWNTAEASPSRYIEDATIRTTFAATDDLLWVANPSGIRRVDAAWIRDADARVDHTARDICASSASGRGEWELQVLCDGRQRFAAPDGSAEWIIQQKIPDSEGFWAGNLLVARIGLELVTFDPTLRRTQTSSIGNASSRLRGVVRRGSGDLVLVEESSGKPNHRLLVYDVRTHRQDAEYHLDAGDRVSIDPTNTYLLRVRSSFGRKAEFSVTHLGDGRILATGQVDEELIDSVVMSPDGRTFAMALLSGGILFVDAPTGAIRRPRTFHPVPVKGIGMTEHRESLLTTGFDFAHSWDLNWGYPASTAPYIPNATVAVSPKGGLGLAAKSEVHTFGSGPERTFPMHRSTEPSWLAVSNDGQYAAWLEDNSDGTYDLWGSDGTLLCRNAIPESGKFSPDSSKLATVCNKGLLRVYDLAARRWLPGSVRVREGVPVTFESEGKWLAAAETSKVCVRDAVTLAVKDCVDTESAPTALAYEIAGESDLIAIATEGGRVEVNLLLERDLPVRLANIPLPSSSARVLAFSVTLELISAGDDGIVRLWSTKDGRLLAMLMGGGSSDRESLDLQETGQKDWLVVSPDGFFDAGGQGTYWIRWRMDRVSYPGDLFFGEFYVPGLLGMILRDEAPPRNPTLDVTSFLKSPGLRALVAQRSARLVRGEHETTLCLADEPTNLRVYVNGAPEAAPQFERDINGPSDCRYRHTWPTAVRVEALNAYGLSGGVGRSTRWDRLRRPLTPGAKLHIIMMAGTDYNQKASGLQALPGVAKNVDAIRVFFVDERRRSKPGAPEIVVHDTIQMQSRRQSLKLLNEALREVNQDDILFLYIAGHGVSPWGQTQFFAVPEDGRADSLDELRLSAVSTVDLAESLRGARARRVLIVVDTCQSAASFETLSKVGEAEIRSEEDLDSAAHALGISSDRGLGFYLLASASPLQFADIPPSGPSQLVKRMLSVWAADSADQRRVTARGMIESFRAEGLQWPESQRPVTAALGMDFDLPSARRSESIAAEIGAVKRADTAKRLGDELRKDGYRNEALAAYRDALKDNPNDTDAANQAGNALSELGRTGEAEQAYRQAIAADDSNAVAHYNLGRILTREGKYRDAVEEQRRSIELSPRYSLANMGLGDALYGMKDFNGALPVYRRAVELDEENESAHFGLANTLNQLAREFTTRREHGKAEQAFQEAGAEYRRTSHLAPKESGPYANLVGVLNEEGKFGDVEAVMKELVQRKAANAPAYINFANALNNLGRYQEAESTARKAISLSPNSTVALNNLGSALNNLGRYGEAESALRNAIAGDPKNAVAYGNLGAALCNAKHCSEAEVAYRKAIELRPNSAFFYIDLANILRMQSRQSEADGLYAQALKLVAAPAGPITSLDREAILSIPRSSSLYIRYGDDLMRAGRLWDAANSFGRAIACDPTNPDAHIRRAEALRRFGQQKDAEAERQKAETPGIHR